MMTFMARGTVYLFVCLTLSFLGGCASVSKVSDWFAKSDKSSESMVADSGAGTAANSAAVYQSHSAPSTESQPASAGTVAGLPPTPNTAPTFPSGIPQEGWTPGTNALPPPSLTTSATAGLYRGGNPAPSLAAKTMEGAGFDLSQHQGRVVLLDFWKTTCGPCLRAVPKVKDLRNQFDQNQLAILGINCDEKLSVANSYVKSNPHPWPQVHAYSQSPNPIRAYGVSVLPVFVVVDQVGNIQYKGNNITTAAAKVAELVGTPSIPQSAGAGFYTAQR